MPTYSNTLLYPLISVGWLESQVTEHAWVLAEPVLTASLILRAAQVGYTFCLPEEINVLLKNPTWMDPSTHIKVRIHIYLLCGVTFVAFYAILGLLQGIFLINLGLVFGCILTPYVHFLNI